MSDSPEKPWSGDSYAPQIPSWVYLVEKESFAGFLIGAIFYGIVIALFFQCMGALLDPNNRTGSGIKWWLVAHTVAMFSFFTIPAAINLNDQSIFFIDNRDFPGIGGIPPGPFGISYILPPTVIRAVHTVMFPLNQWLADGLLLHRCYVIYSMNYWVMFFPFLVYLASVATGIAYTYEEIRPGSSIVTAVNFATSYFSITFSLAVLLTIMIIARLVLHSRDVQKAIGVSGGTVSGVYTAVVTMLVESYALYAIALLLYIVPRSVNSLVVAIFSGLLGAIQVIAPYLITLRVANRRALTSEMVTGSGSIGSIRFTSQGTTEGDETHPDEDHNIRNSAKANERDLGELGIGDKNVIEEIPL